MVAIFPALWAMQMFDQGGGYGHWEPDWKDFLFVLGLIALGLFMVLGVVVLC